MYIFAHRDQSYFNSLTTFNCLLLVQIHMFSFYWLWILTFSNIIWIVTLFPFAVFTIPFYRIYLWNWKPFPYMYEFMYRLLYSCILVYFFSYVFSFSWMYNFSCDCDHFLHIVFTLTYFCYYYPVLLYVLYVSVIYVYLHSCT